MKNPWELKNPSLYWNNPDAYTASGGDNNLTYNFINNPLSTSMQFLPALTSLLGTTAAISDIQRQSNATIANIKSMGDQLAFSSTYKSQQLQELEQTLGDKLSMSGLQTLKDEATIKAMNAESGASGGSKNEVITNRYTQQNLKDAEIVRSIRNEKENLKTSMVADLLSFNNNTESMMSTMLTPLSAGLKTFGTSLSYYNLGLGMLPTSTKNTSLGVSDGVYNV